MSAIYVFLATPCTVSGKNWIKDTTYYTH